MLAAQNLAPKIPGLSSQLIENHPHIGQSEPGFAQGYIRNGEFRVKPRKLEDGSIVQPTDEARESIAKILRKSGFEDIPIQQALTTFDLASENVRVEIVPGLEVVKWTIQKVEPDLTKAPLMDLLIPAKAAFEFLALHVGTAISYDSHQLTEVRKVLLGSIQESDILHVERLFSGEYDAFHGIVFEGNDPYAKVQIRLFGWLAFRVHFLNLFVGGPRFVYTHRLDSGEERIAIIDGH